MGIAATEGLEDSNNRGSRRGEKDWMTRIIEGRGGAEGLEDLNNYVGIIR